MQVLEVREREKGEGRAGAVALAALPTAAVRVGQPKMVDDDDDDVRGGVSQVAFCQIFIRRRFYRLRCWLPTSACV